MEAEETKRVFYDLVARHIGRDGISNLMKYLETTQFFTAPASSRYHYPHEGGLAEHAVNTYLRLVNLLKSEYGDACPYSEETVAIVSLFHGIGKEDLYQKTTRNVKDASGNWSSVQCYTTAEDRYLIGSCEERTLYTLMWYMRISPNEARAILYSKGSDASNADPYHDSTMLTVYRKCPLALFLMQAAQQSSLIGAPKEPVKKEDNPVDKPDESSSGEDDDIPF